MFDVSLQRVANFAEIFGALLVIIGIIFALYEIRQHRQQRRETAAMEIMRAFQSPDFTRTLRLVMEFEQECRSCRDDSISPELQDAAVLVSTTLESIEFMVYQRIVPFGLVQQTDGGHDPGQLAGVEAPHGVVKGEALPLVHSRVVPVAVGAAERVPGIPG